MPLQEKERFEIKDDQALNWVFREILAPLKKEVARIEEMAAVEIDRVNKWKESELKSPKSDIEYWESLIQKYHFEELLRDPKRKTLSTPYGKSKSRRSAEQPEQVDKQALLEHVLTNDMQDFIKKDVRWADLKKTLQISEMDGGRVAVDENGMIVPGVIIKPESITYSVEVSE
ncbi:host-nuclease inhibitor Gam family protein [Sporosarcina highlanderae]|uniref:Host-nuclease inhibitor Gam family protein n=1 Tax=Sporosarcina highlanderae TaxID=3035916 RepID=A0ABT8JVF3_9BACL|nr:host-nuclease inhibitor Gam family protein [Sporosarcina highlanderae]MDN4609156.1 host-nuclease inhibitor Gam family protein [Sporosarcina highlanderae]